MSNLTVPKNEKEIKTYLLNSISSLKKEMTGYEAEKSAERKLKWYLRKNKYNDDLDKIEESLRKPTILNKK
jgi:hypothetical protein